MLKNSTDCTWTIRVRNARTGEIVSASGVRPHKTIETFVMLVECHGVHFKRYTDVVLNGDGVYFNGVAAGTRRNGATIVRFLDSHMTAVFKVVR